MLYKAHFVLEAFGACMSFVPYVVSTGSGADVKMAFDHGERPFVAMAKAIATKPWRVRPLSGLTYA